MEYFEVPTHPGDGRCSDNSCPCSEPGTLIPKGSGYLYISQEAVNFRRNCRTIQQFREEMKRIMRPDTFYTFHNPEAIAPILICEQGAKLRRLDMEVAAADAKYWWETGKVPLRATPLYKSSKAAAKPNIESETNTKAEKPEQAQKQAKEKKTDIFEILMDAICCVMCADRKVSTMERKAIHKILEKTNAPWLEQEIDNRIDGFIQRVKKNGLNKIVQKTCGKVPEFKRRGKEKVLVLCLDYMARADGIVHENEKKVIEKFSSIVELNAVDSTVDKKSHVAGNKKQANITTNEDRKPKYDRIDYLWDSGRTILHKHGLRTSTPDKHLEKLVAIYTEIIEIVDLLDESEEYRATASLRNRAITYRVLHKFDAAIEDFKQEMAIAQRKHVGWQVTECRRLIAETQKMKEEAEIKAEGGGKSEKFKSMEELASRLFSSGADGNTSFENLFTDLKSDDVNVRAKASRLLADSPNALSKLIEIYKKSIDKDPRKSVLAGRVLGRKIDGGKEDMVHAQTAMIMFGIQVAFTPCVCGHCSKLNVGIPVPENGLYIGFYGQTDDKRGAYALPVLCDYCGKEFFIAWDSDPR